MKDYLFRLGIKSKNIYHNPYYELLFEHETKESLMGYEKGQLTELDAINVMTGVYTGRSPKDKFIVDTEAIHNDIAWGKVNRPISREAFNSIRDTLAISSVPTRISSFVTLLYSTLSKKWKLSSNWLT